MSRCHIFSACPPIWYFIEVLSSSRVVSVARAPIVIVLQWYRYSQAQQQVKAFFSPLQMSEDPGMLDSSCCHIKTHQNYIQQLRDNPAWIAIHFDRQIQSSSPSPCTAPSTEQVTHSSSDLTSLIHTGEPATTLTAQAPFLCTFSTAEICTEAEKIPYSLKWTIIHCHAGLKWMALTIQKGKKRWFLLCRLEKQAAIGKQMVEANISHITLQKGCMFKCQSFPVFSWSWIDS